MVLIRRLAAAGGFLVLWAGVGFVLGSSTLLGPVRWTLDRIRATGGSESLEAWSVRGWIALLVAVSLAVAVWIGRTVRRTPARHLRFGLPALVLTFAAGQVWMWMQPDAVRALDRPVRGGVPGLESATSASARFTFGPYPDESMLMTLRDEGVTAVVSLLHRAVVPMEPIKLMEERAAAERVGIPLIHAPMLPWIGDNRESLDRVRALAREGSGHYYVHCYLGRDRVRMVRRVVEKTAAESGSELTVDDRSTLRTLADMTAFERGGLFRHPAGVWVTPYPTDEEFVVFLGAGNVSTVVSLLDPENPDDVPWIEREREQFTSVGIRWELRTLPSRPYEPDRVLDLVREVLAFEPPVVVHAFLGADTGRSPQAEGFWMALATGRPPLPTAHFTEPLAGGAVLPAAVHVAVGPTPSGPEFGARLGPVGVRTFLRVGDPADPEVQEIRAVCDTYGFDCRFDAEWNGEVLRRFERDGPWYVFGPGLPEDAATRIAERYGPAFPTSAAPDAWSARIAEIERNRAAAVAASDTGAETSETGFLARAVPSPSRFWVWSPIFLLASAVAARLVSRLRVERGVRTPYTRKVFHFAIFTGAALVQWLGGLSALMLFGSVTAALVVYALFRGDGFPFYEALARPTDAPHRSRFVWIPLGTTAIGGLLANLWFPGTALIGYLVGGWGDAIGEPVGTRWGRHRYRVPSLFGVPATRSLEGSLAVAVAGSIAATLGAAALGATGSSALVVGLACGASGAAVEAFSNHGLDNLTIQIAAAGTAAFLL